MDDGAVVLDAATGRVVLGNRSAARILGFSSPDALVGLDPMNFVPHEGRQLAARILAESREEAQDSPVEIRLITADKRDAWVSARATAMDYGGRRAILATIRDITRDKARVAIQPNGDHQYEHLFDRMLDGTVVLDVATFKIAWASRAAAAMFGFPSPEDMIGKNPLDHIPEEDRSRIVHMIATNIEGKHKDPAELQVITNDGRRIWISATATEVCHEGQAAIITTMRNVTADKAKDAALKVAEESQMQLIDAAGEAIFILQDGKVAYVNPAGARGAGLSRDELTGVPFLDMVHPDHRQEVMERHERLTAGQFFPGLFMTKGVTARGETRWCSVQEIPYMWRGRPAIMSLLSDITDRVLAEQALKHEEERLRAIMENAWDGVAILDRDFRIMFESPSLARMTGYPPEEWTGITPERFQVHPEDLPSMLAQMESLKGHPGAVIQDVVIRYRHRDGSWRTMEATGCNLLDDPKVMGMVINFRDITERVKAEQALRDSEERFRALIEKASDTIMIMDADARIQYYSPSIARTTGYRSEDWKLRGMADWRLHPDDLALLPGLLAEVLQAPGKSIDNIQVRYMHEDGTWHTLEAMVRNMLHDPKINGIVANFRDITERVKAEQALRESEERYRLLAENVSDVIWVIDMNMKPTYVSPSAQRMLGYTGEQFMRGSIESMLTRESARVAMMAFSKAMSRESEQPGTRWDALPLDLQFIRADGSTLWTTANFSYIRGPDGKPMAMLGVLKDISGRKKAEDSLRRSEERFRSLVEASSDWVWEMDAGNRYTYVSPKVQDILGHEPQDLLGRTPFEFMHQEEGRRVSGIMQRFAAERLPFQLLQNTAAHKDGRAVVLESSAIPVLDSDGRLTGYRGINRDITERKKVEQELQRSLRRLEKMMESAIEAITTTIETRDPYTTGHQMRVTDLACAIARVMEVPPGKIEGIRVAGLLHDIGKIAVPTEILSKPGKLNEVEYEMIKTHAKTGYNILKKIEFPWPVARAVLQHHERWNGSGYPYGIRGEDILLEARILAVADVMEAMSSHRPYRPSIGADKALAEIARNSGILYDPAVANACITAFSELGFEFSAALPSIAAEADAPPPERHVRYPLEDH